MQNMKGIIRSQYGTPDVIEVATLERPVPQDDEVLIRVKAAGIDYGVWHFMAGMPYAVRLGIGLFQPRDRQLGMDVSGVIEAIGAKVTRFKVGDAVFGATRRTFAEFTTAREDELVLKPERLSFEQAAVTAISGVTALQAVRAGQVKAGQSVCIIGAGGGVGSWAVQLARHLGARVTAVCSASKADFVRSLGASEVIDYAKEPLPADGRFDVILDFAGNRSLGVLRQALTAKGTLVLGGGEAGDRWLGGMGRSLRAAVWSMFSKKKTVWLLALVKPEPLQALVKLLEEAPTVVPAVDRTFALEDAADGLRALIDRNVRGKLALRVSA